MTKRHRVNPFDRGTPEHLLHERMRRSRARADQLQSHATSYQTEADAERAKADHYARALEALAQPSPLRIEGPK